MKKKLLRALLPLARLFGCFALARRLTRRDLRILCYHGAAISDEHSFRGGLYIHPELFESRLAFLSRQRYPVLKLGDALRLLDEGELPDCATVITIDDGWSGTALKMAPILERYGFPATLYVSTYYLEKQTQVFHVAVDYVMWRSQRASIDLSDVSDELEGVYRLGDEQDRAAATAALWTYAESLADVTERQSLFRDVCATVDVDARELESSRAISFMTMEEAAELPAKGIDLQLHTHRHRFPADDFDAAQREIDDNRNRLSAIAPDRLEHFCYPSGEYEPHQFAWLRKMGVTSATTTQGGFVTPKINRLEMGRFMDSEYVSGIEFEAEMCGLFELARRCGYAI